MRILYVTTISKTINAFLIPHIMFLLDQGHQVDIACNMVEDIDAKLIERGCRTFNVNFQRSPLSKNNYFAFGKLKKIILDNNYNLVHTHTPVASVCVRIVCKNLDNVKVFYTAHGFHFFKGASIINWLLYFPVEKWLSKYTDLLITINKEDYNRASRLFRMKKVEYINGVGIDIGKYKNVRIENSEKRRELGVEPNSFLILSVGEINENKNHETIIRAIARLDNINIQYAICGKGPSEIRLKSLIIKLGLEKQVILLGYRRDIPEICKVADIFAFPSQREGLGMAAIEAMASGLPLITSNVHGINDYSINGKTGFKCDPDDIEGFSKAIHSLLIDSKLRKKISIDNAIFADKFNINNALNELKRIYSENI